MWKELIKCFLKKKENKCHTVSHKLLHNKIELLFLHSFIQLNNLSYLPSYNATLIDRNQPQNSLLSSLKEKGITRLMNLDI